MTPRCKLQVMTLLVFSLFALLGSDSANADIPNPEYPISRCNPGEEMVTCDFRSKEPLGPLTKDECAPYRDNPNYRYLTGTGGSLGGSSKYCLSPDAQSTRQRMTLTGFVVVALAVGSFKLLSVLRNRNITKQ